MRNKDNNKTGLQKERTNEINNGIILETLEIVAPRWSLFPPVPSLLADGWLLRKVVLLRGPACHAACEPHHMFRKRCSAKPPPRATRSDLYVPARAKNGNTERKNYRKKERQNERKKAMKQELERINERKNERTTERTKERKSQREQQISTERETQKERHE